MSLFLLLLPCLNQSKFPLSFPFLRREREAQNVVLQHNPIQFRMLQDGILFELDHHKVMEFRLQFLLLQELYNLVILFQNPPFLDLEPLESLSLVTIPLLHLLHLPIVDINSLCLPHLLHPGIIRVIFRLQHMPVVTKLLPVILILPDIIHHIRREIINIPHLLPFHPLGCYLQDQVLQLIGHNTFPLLSLELPLDIFEE